MPHPWKHSKSGWTGLWATWSSWRCPCALQEGWARWPLKVPSNKNYLVIQSVLEVWQWGQQWADIYWDILKMALEHPQKQYWYGQNDGPVCIILSSQGQGIYLLHFLFSSKQNFSISGGGNKRKPAVLYQADRTIATNYRMTRCNLLFLEYLPTLSCIRERGSRTEIKNWNKGSKRIPEREVSIVSWNGC